MDDVIDQSVEEDVAPEAEAESTEPETSDGKPLRPDFLNLPEHRIDQLRSLVNKLSLRDQWARQIEILRCTLKRYFWLGMQHVWWNQDATCFQVGQQGGQVTSENLNEEDGTAMQDFNIFKPNGKIFISVFAQNPATVRMEPDQPKEPASIRAAAEAEKYVRVYDKNNPPKDAQITIGRLLWIDGRVVGITESSPDGQTERTEYAGVLESKMVPMFETDFQRIVGVKISKDHDILAMKGKHPDVADELVNGTKSSTPNDEIARMARISTAESITQLSHDSLAYLSTEDRWWLRPAAFHEGLSDEDRKYWTEIFPDGCKVTFCGEVFCGGSAVSMDDAIDVMHAEPGEGQARNSLGDPHVPVQMEFNDGMNLTAELLKFCVPSLWADIDQEDFAAIKEQLAQYGQIRPKKRKNGEPMGNDFFPEPQVEAPQILGVWLENLQGTLTQLVTGNQPAMWGGNMEDQKTAKAYAQAKDMSLGLLTIVWVPFSTFMASIHEKAAKLASKRDRPFAALVSGKANKQETLEINPETMRGGFTCSAVVDQGFPESWTSKSQTVKGLMAAAPTNPMLMQNLQLPDNLVLQRDAIGLPELVIEGADSRDKQLEEWAEMQKGEGVELDAEATQQRDQQRAMQASQAAAMLGAGAQLPPLPQLPPIMKSSIPVDPEAEDHVAEALECFRILNSPEGLKIKGTADMDGTPLNPQQPGRSGMAIWQDLKAHMMAHVAAGQAKGLIFPPPLGGPPPMPMMPPKPGIGAPPPGAPGAGAPPPPGGNNAAQIPA